MTALSDGYAILDAQFDYNIKLITLLILIVYTIGLWYITKKIETPKTLWEISLKFGAKLFIYPTILFLPWTTIFLFRDYAAITLWTTMISFYGIIFFAVAAIAILFGWSRVLEMFDIHVDWAEVYGEKLNKGERNG